MDTKLFAECMKRNMTQKNITTEELAEMTGISAERLQSLESSSSKPNASELHKISAAIGVPPLILMEGGGLIQKLCRNEDGTSREEWCEY